MDVYKIMIHHDVHGDIVGLEFFENETRKAHYGYKCGSASSTKIQKVNCSGPMWVIYNTIVDSLNGRKAALLDKLLVILRSSPTNSYVERLLQENRNLLKEQER